MMNGMGGEMMWGMGLIWIIVIIVLVLSAAALIKYLRAGGSYGASPRVDPPPNQRDARLP